MVGSIGDGSRMQRRFSMHDLWALMFISMRAVVTVES